MEALLETGPDPQTIALRAAIVSSTLQCKPYVRSLDGGQCESDLQYCAN